MTQYGRQEPGEPYRRINLDEAAEMLKTDESLVVDVRNLDEWQSGHVEGAIHIPVDDILGRVNELPTDKDLLFICAMGVRSGLACEMTAAMGLSVERLYNIEDGTAAWIEKGLPTRYEK